MTKNELTQFEDQLTVLCQKYNVWIRAKSQKEEQPQNRVCYHEYTLSLKVENSKREENIRENNKW